VHHTRNLSRMASMQTLSIIIPVYNEEKTVCEVLDRVAQVPLSVAKEIIIVNDGSTDHSPERIRAWAAVRSDSSRLRIVVVEKSNGGKGSAVRAGIAVSTGDVVIIQDADLEYDPSDFQKCIDPILTGGARVVYGSRERSRRKHPHSSAAFYLGGLLVTRWMNLLYGAHMTDEPTCYKTFDGPLIRALPFEGDSFDWEPEVTAKLLRLGYEIVEVPINYVPRKVHEGKKLKWRDGLRAIWVALVWRFRSIKGIQEPPPESL